MADSVITEPSGSNVNSSGWTAIIAKLTKQSRGLHAVSLDTYDLSATAPSVIDGGIYEINGTYYEVTADTQLTGMSSTSTQYYIYSDSGTWTASTDEPEWNADKFGWYDSTDANSRCFFKIFVDSSGNYTNIDALINQFGGRPMQLQTIVQTGSVSNGINTISVTGFDFTPTAILDVQATVWFASSGEGTDNNTGSASLFGTSRGASTDGGEYCRIISATVGTNSVSVRLFTGNVDSYSITAVAAKTP